MSDDGTDANKSFDAISFGDDAVMLPASYVQELLWLMDRASHGSSAYNVPRTRRLLGPLNVTALRHAFDSLVARHEILRTTYAFHEERAVQVVRAPRSVEFTKIDLRDRPEAERQAEAQRLALEYARKPFDLSRDQLLRVVLMQLGDEDHVLHLGSHHIAFDGWSRGILFRELAALYAEFDGGPPAALPELPIQYADYAIWEREHLSGDRLRGLLDYWKQQLGDADFRLDLPTDFPRPAVPGFGGVTEHVTFSSDRLAKIKALGQSRDASLYMTLLAAFTAVLHRYTGQRDVLVGSPIAGRSRLETEGLIGYFANTIVQRARFSEDPTFAQLIDQVRESALGAYDHQEIPFEKLVLELQGGQELSHSPLFQVVFTQLGAGTDDVGATHIGAAKLTSFGIDQGTTKFDLTLFMSERDDALTLSLRGRSDLFTPETVARFVEHLRRVLEAAIANPDQRISELPLLSPEESARITALDVQRISLGSETTVHELVAAQATKVPHRAAVVSGDETITYAQLDARANRIARRLRALGVTDDATVGVTLDRSVDLVAAILGILKAGAAYLPVLPELPAARIAHQLSASHTSLVISRSEFRDHLPPDVATLLLDTDADAVEGEWPTAPAVNSRPDGLAYVLHTSGSTGVPKGVMVTHRNIVHYARAISRVFADVPPAVAGDGFATMDGWQFGMVSTLSADLGNTSLFPSLLAGGTLHLLQKDATTDPARYAEYLAAHPLDVLKITPNHLRALLGAVGMSELARHLPRKWIVLGGEALSWDFAQRLLDAGSCRVLNHYGPTETTVGVSTFEVTGESMRSARAAGSVTVPIGRPLANTRLHVLDGHRHLVPGAVAGELYISGDGVSRGYLGRDDLTAERFVELPGVGRAYRTGDRTRRLADGLVEFLGRRDEQVKIRGYRVELSEIEQVLAEHPLIAQCVAVVRAGSNDDAAQLVMYAVPRPVTSDYASAHAERATPESFQKWIAGRLPDYMVPSAMVMLEQMPLSANGKIDRAALPDPSQDAIAIGPEYVEPNTATEESIAKIWATVFKKDRVGVTENFIALGGHSLLAIRVLGNLSRQFGVRLPLRSLFDAPTVRDLAELVDVERQLAALDALSGEV